METTPVALGLDHRPEPARADRGNRHAAPGPQAVGQAGIARNPLPGVTVLGAAELGAHRAEAALSVLDSKLAGRCYLCAANPTITDLFCYADVAFADICAFDMQRWPNVAEWSNRVTALHGFQAPFSLLAMEDAEVA